MPELTNPEFIYTVSTAGNQTVVSGKNDGNIRGRGGKSVEWNGVGGVEFALAVTELLENDDSSAPAPVADAFDEPLPVGEVATFKAKLRKLSRGEPVRILKYTVTATGAQPADPLIIVDR